MWLFEARLRRAKTKLEATGTGQSYIQQLHHKLTLWTTRFDRNEGGAALGMPAQSDAKLDLESGAREPRLVDNGFGLPWWAATSFTLLEIKWPMVQRQTP